MPRLLHIHSAPTGPMSVSRDLSQFFVDKWCESHADVEVDTLDLVVENLPHYDPTVADNPISEKLCTQLEAADIVVIGSPMYNLTYSTYHKSWIDHVTVAGRTFEYIEPSVARGKLTGKKVFVIEARGGDYTEFPFSAADFQEPILKLNLSYLGLYDVTFVRAEGMRAEPDKEEAIIRGAKRRLEALVG